MINPDFEQVLSDSFFLSMEETQVFSSKKILEVTPIQNESEIQGDFFSMLTVSSVDFRIIYNLHYSLNKPTRNAIREQVPESETELVYDDYILEYSNLYCGVFKRKLNATIALLGMSTPDLMESNCIKHFLDANSDYNLFGKLSFTENCCFFFSLIVFTDRDIKPDTLIVHDDVVEGEIELF